MVKSEWRPRVKPEHGLERTPDNHIRIGGAVYGVAAEVLDRTGAVWTMLQAADGTRSPDEIVAQVLLEHPAEQGDAVHAALDRLVDAGYLEDAAAPDPPALTAREKERYERSRQFFRWIDLNRRDSSWDPQVRLKRARVVVVGLGGTGGTAALALAATGVGRLHCVDSDAVELSNLNRQVMFEEADVGRSKVDVAVRRLRRLNSDIDVTGECTNVSGESDLRVLVRDCDVLLLCADRPGEIRAWANRVCLDTGTPWVDAGYHGPAVTAAVYIPGRGPCYECVWRGEWEQHNLVEPHRRYTVERDSSNAVTASSAGLSGHLAAHLATALIAGVAQVEPGQTQGINLAAVDPHILIRYPRHPRCPACGAKR
jgi:molybdopterin/thiamine biosynthesis adenylyltransferase